MNKCKATVELIENIERCGGLYRVIATEDDCPVMLLHDGHQWIGVERFQLTNPHEPYGGPEHTRAFRQAAQAHNTAAVAIFGGSLINGRESAFAVIQFRGETEQTCVVWDHDCTALSRRRLGVGDENITLPNLFDPDDE